MSKLKIKVNGMSMEAAGGDDFIQREREAFTSLTQQIRNNLNISIIPMAKAESDEKQKPVSALSAEEPEAKANACVVTRYRAIENNSSWYDIRDKILRDNQDNIFHAGDTISCTLTNGKLAEFVITEVTDKHVRFESVGFVGDETSWNNTDTTKGGYPESDIRKYMDNTIWGLLPEDLKSVTSCTTREWIDKDGNEGTYDTKLFLPAASEVFDEDDCYGDEGAYEQLEWYKSAKNRIRVGEDGDTCGWWLGSVRSGSSAYACNVGSFGRAYCWTTTDEFRVPVCFLISKISLS